MKPFYHRPWKSAALGLGSFKVSLPDNTLRPSALAQATRPLSTECLVVRTWETRPCLQQTVAAGSRPASALKEIFINHVWFTDVLLKKKQNPNFLEKHNPHEWLQLCIMSLVLKENQKIKVYNLFTL